jgi:hypothetical protein
MQRSKGINLNAGGVYRRQRPSELEVLSACTSPPALEVRGSVASKMALVKNRFYKR